MASLLGGYFFAIYDGSGSEGIADMKRSNSLHNYMMHRILPGVVARQNSVEEQSVSTPVAQPVSHSI